METDHTMTKRQTNWSTDLQRQLTTIGIEDCAIAFVGCGSGDRMDPYAQELMLAALRGRPVIATATCKESGQIGKELLHAMACIPPDASSLTTFEAGRLGLAGAKINALTIEVVDLLRSREEALTALSAFSRDGNKPLLGIDFRVRASAPPFRPPDESLKKLVFHARELDVPLVVAIESNASWLIWEELYGM